MGLSMAAVSSRKYEMYILENIEHGIDSFQKTRNGYLVIWDQYLQESMNWKFGNFQLNELKQLKVILFSLKGS